MEQNLPRSCRINFDDANVLHLFTLTISPDEGYWAGGRFKFLINIPEDYNIVVSHLSAFKLSILIAAIIFDECVHRLM